VCVLRCRKVSAGALRWLLLLLVWRSQRSPEQSLQSFVRFDLRRPDVPLPAWQGARTGGKAFALGTSVGSAQHPVGHSYFLRGGLLQNQHRSRSQRLVGEQQASTKARRVAGGPTLAREASEPKGKRRGFNQPCQKNLSPRRRPRRGHLSAVQAPDSTPMTTSEQFVRKDEEPTVLDECFSACCGNWWIYPKLAYAQLGIHRHFVSCAKGKKPFMQHCLV